MDNPRFSLIVATLGRTDELKCLFQSMTAQRYENLEVMIVDQNQDDRIAELLAEARPGFQYLHIRCDPGVSAARNRGLKMAAGDIVAFPDDDCEYSSDLLANVDQWFRENENYAVLAVGAFDNSGVPSGNRWIQDSCDIKPLNAIRTTFCSSLFIRRSAIPPGVGFDENLNRGEETDFILRLLKPGLNGRFDRRWHVYHPCRDMLSGAVTGDRAFSYGAGMGNLARRHSLFGLWLGLLAYDLARAVLVVVRGRLEAARVCFAHTLGLFSGYVRGQAL